MGCKGSRVQISALRPLKQQVVPRLSGKRGPESPRTWPQVGHKGVPSSNLDAPTRTWRRFHFGSWSRSGSNVPGSTSMFPNVLRLIKQHPSCGCATCRPPMVYGMPACTDEASRSAAMSHNECRTLANRTKWGGPGCADGRVTGQRQREEALAYVQVRVGDNRVASTMDPGLWSIHNEQSAGATR
jgi:hypothetical protein